MHEDSRTLARRFGALQLGRCPGELRVIQPEVRAAGAGRDDIQEQATMPASHNGFWQVLSAKDRVECLQGARVEVVIAG